MTEGGDLRDSLLGKQILSALAEREYACGIPPIPAPPKPQGTGRRTWARYRKAMSVWSVAERSRRTLNMLIRAPDDNEPTPTATSTQRH